MCRIRAEEAFPHQHTVHQHLTGQFQLPSYLVHVLLHSFVSADLRLQVQ